MKLLFTSLIHSLLLTIITPQPFHIFEEDIQLSLATAQRSPWRLLLTPSNEFPHFVSFILFFFLSHERESSLCLSPNSFHTFLNKWEYILGEREQTSQRRNLWHERLFFFLGKHTRKIKLERKRKFRESMMTIRKISEKKEDSKKCLTVVDSSIYKFYL